MKRISYLAVAAMVAGLTIPAFATHNHPMKASSIDVWLVRAFLQCKVPTLFHDPPLAFQSCVPSPFFTTKSFGPKGWGRVLINVFPALAAAGFAPATDVKVRARLVDVRDGGVPVTSGSLTLNIPLRITDHRCAGLPCTMVSVPFTLPLSCGTPVGVCRTVPPVSSFNTVVPGTVAGGFEANVEMGQIEVFDGPDLVFVQGTYWP